MAMLTRRRVLQIGGAAIAMAPRDRVRAAPRSPVDFALPVPAWDCHVHVIGDPAHFPMAADRIYTPPPASVEALLTMEDALHLQRTVLVQPSFYGTDNSMLLDALKRPAIKLRGVAVVDETATGTALDAMAAAGVRGLRINLETAGEFDPAMAARKLETAIAQCRPRGWHIQLYTRPTVIAALADRLTDPSVPLVLDHFAGARAAQGVDQPGFSAVLDLVRSGKAYVKISAAYRASKAPYDDIVPFAQALVAANPDRILWGSDWPHTDSAHVDGRAATDITPFIPIDDGMMLNQLPRWVPDAALRRKILADNPAHLYGL